MFDDESFDMWERFLVRTFGSWPAGVPAALAYVAAAAERLRAWRVDAGPLVDVVTHALRVPPNSEADPRAAEHYAALVGSRCYTRVAATVPPELDAPVAPDDVDRSCSRWVEAGWCAGVRPPLRYLASKAFASWTAYQSRGVRTQVAELFVAATVLRVEAARVCARTQSPLTDAGWHAAIRAADLLLVHLADREGLMSWLGRAERDDHELDAP
jgi:hypothetical protein